MTLRIIPILTAIAALFSSGCSACFFKKATGATPAVTYTPGHGSAKLQCVYRTPEDEAHPTCWASKRHGTATCGKPLPVGARAVSIPTGSFVDYDIHFTTNRPWNIPPPDQTVRILNNQLSTVTIYYQ